MGKKKQKDDNTQIVTRKIKINIIDNEKRFSMKRYKDIDKKEKEAIRTEQYAFLRNAMYAQYRALNMVMGRRMSCLFSCGMNDKSDDYKNFIKNYKINKSTPDFKDINFGIGVDTPSFISKIIDSSVSKSIADGLLRGDVRIPQFKRNYPLKVRWRSLAFEYKDEKEDDVICTTSFCGGITFFCNLGYKKNGLELKHTLHKIINKEYEYGDCSIINDGKDWFLLIPVKMPKIKKEAVKNRVLGVDMGLAIPAYVAISDNQYKRKGLGCYEELAKAKMQFKDRRRRLQRQLTLVKGGKGRNKKLSNLNSLRDKEREYTKNYNHNLSKKIVQFAIDNQCEYINIEYLKSNTMDSKILGNWTYFELQTMITYKAEKAGIKVRKVKAANTSRMCSKCGYIHEDNRKSQSKFMCTSETCDNVMNADHNAAINISRSVEFVGEKEEEELEENAI